MKIAIYHNLPSGGGKRALYEITKRLAVRHAVDVYTLSTAEYDFCDLRPLVRKHEIFPFQTLPLIRSPFGRLNQGIRTVDLLRLETVQHRVAAQIDAAGYDVVFVHNCRLSQSPGLLKFLHTPKVFYSAEPPRLLYEPPSERPYNRFSQVQRVGNLFDPLPGLYRMMLRRLDWSNVRAAGVVLVNSHYSRETLYRVYGVPAYVCYLGVDAKCFRPLAFSREQRVVSVGALTPKKGFDLVICSLAEIKATQRPALTIISNFTDLDERGFLQELARSRAVEVEFRSGVSDSELVENYNRVLLTVYTPIMEPFGFVPLESMACGTPVVGVREAGVRETVVHEATGLLAERDPVCLAVMVSRLVGDPDLRARLGTQGSAYVQTEWSWDRSVKHIEDHLNRAAHGLR